MAFTAGFYNFTIDLNNVDRQVFTRFRVKTARHPNESLEHLYARMLAYAHSFKDGQTFTQGLFEPKEPTIWKRDIIGGLELWIQLGVPDKKKLEHALREGGKTAEIAIYFWQNAQVNQFCHMLRGSKTNWVEAIKFYQFDEALLSELTAFQKSSPELTITFTDNRLYLGVDGNEFETEVMTVDIWAAYQESLLMDENGQSTDA
jgi:uncharacterized protein YaeQ